MKQKIEIKETNLDQFLEFCELYKTKTSQKEKIGTYIQIEIENEEPAMLLRIAELCGRINLPVHFFLRDNNL